MDRRTWMLGIGAGSTALEVTERVDLTGRTMLVTGVTSGVGLETMRVLALRGAHVIGSGRSLARAREACASVRGRTTPLALELTDYPSVVACAAAVQALGVPLDALVCNAGVMALPKLEQVAGIERQFATNHLGHFLLVHRLLAALRAAPQGRVVVVSSGVLGWSDPAGIEWDNLSGMRGYDPSRAYGQSKLANALFALELSRRFAGCAATSCYVATAPALAGVSGQFFRDCNPVIPDPRAADRDAAARLRAVSEGLLGEYLG